MKQRTSLFILFSASVMAALACNMPTGRSAPTNTEDTVATQTPITLTQAGTQDQNPTAAQPESSANGMPTETPEPTLTPSPSPSVTPTPTESIPIVSVSVDTNCRSGPGIVYDYLDALLVGEEAEVIGKYTGTMPTYWIIKKGSITCWLWGEYATVEGDTSKLPEKFPPPTPTPSPTATATATPEPTAE